MRVTERVLAAICFLLGLPAALLKLPALPVTVMAFVQTLHEFSTIGTESYQQDRHARFIRLIVALILYAFGSIALFGLPIVAATRCHRTLSLIVWLCVLSTGIGLPLFERNRIIPQTDRFYVVSVVHLPLCIAVLSFIGVLLWCYGARHRLHAKPTA